MSVVAIGGVMLAASVTTIPLNRGRGIETD